MSRTLRELFARLCFVANTRLSPFHKLRCSGYHWRFANLTTSTAIPTKPPPTQPSYTSTCFSEISWTLLRSVAHVCDTGPAVSTTACVSIYLRIQQPLFITSDFALCCLPTLCSWACSIAALNNFGFIHDWDAAVVELASNWCYLKE